MKPVWIPFLLAAGVEGNPPWPRVPRLLVLMLTWGCTFQLPWGDNPSTLLREGFVKQKYVRDIWSWVAFYGENLAQTLSKTRLNPFEILRNATRILQELSSNSDRSSFEFRSSHVCVSLKCQSHPLGLRMAPDWASLSPELNRAQIPLKA